MTVKFEKVTVYEDIDFNMPQRKTRGSAGYDFEVIEDIVIPSHYYNLINILIAKVGSEESISNIEKLSIFKELVRIGGTSEDLTKGELGARELLKIRKAFPEAKEFIRDTMNMDLGELKDSIGMADAKVTLVPTGIKVHLKENQKLDLFIRSSSAIGAYLMLGNSVGVVDSDYVNNESNEGHIAFPIINLSPFNVTLKKGDIIGQGVISEFCVVDNDDSNFVRIGGMGSTDEEVK